MSVIVENLTKLYDTQKAIDGVSFQAKPAEVLGFLGPNGAGKTTTMKIITGYIPPSEGRAEVCGYDVEADSMEARRRIGYLPEHNPLYLDMYVREYLAFVARLHRVGDVRRRVAEIVERTGLEREQHKIIGSLSKGYRQRVGLAQAMIHDPEVLILDEPTSGLDPNQLVEIRQLIRRLGQEKTVIFSTHIMQEAQAICDRVVIIDRGRLVADDPIEALQDRIAGQTIVTVEFADQLSAADLKAIPGVRQVRPAGRNRWQLIGSAKQDLRPAVFRFAVDRKIVLLEMHKEAFSVEEVFQQLTRQAHDQN